MVLLRTLHYQVPWGTQMVFENTIETFEKNTTIEKFWASNFYYFFHNAFEMN